MSMAQTAWQVNVERLNVLNVMDSGRHVRVGRLHVFLYFDSIFFFFFYVDIILIQVYYLVMRHMGCQPSASVAYTHTPPLQF